MSGTEGRRGAHSVRSAAEAGCTTSRMRSAQLADAPIRQDTNSRQQSGGGQAVADVDVDFGKQTTSGGRASGASHIYRWPQPENERSGRLRPGGSWLQRGLLTRSEGQLSSIGGVCPMQARSTPAPGPAYSGNTNGRGRALLASVPAPSVSRFMPSAGLGHLIKPRTCLSAHGSLTAGARYCRTTT
ncbi:hypothetical protein BDZ91DRAFT_764906 [Kalaharituber pfeilii]|nr:hypothetical protein BDZ91DRAFT_764906 [Kalaharituber pfeilii]